MFLKEADYYRQVVLKIPGQAGGNATTTFTFADQPDIRNARMIAMELYCSTELAFAQPEPIAVVPPNLLPLITFTFETNDPDDIEHHKGVPGVGNISGTLDTIQWIPATSMRVTQGFGAVQAPFVRSHIMWKNRYIIWQKSTVNIGPGGLKNTSDLAIVLGCHYSFLTEDNKPIQRS